MSAASYSQSSLLHGEVEQLRQANQQLQEDLARERSLRQQSEDAGAKSQKTRDELVRSVLLAEKRAADAEEEQLRAEHELAALMQQMRQQQEQQQQKPIGTGGFGSAAGSSLEAVLAELEAERRRSEQLTASAAAAQAEARSAGQQLEALRQQRQYDGSASAAGLRPSASSTSLAGEGGAEGAGLAQRVAALKAARDKLIAALDLQAAEVERLSAENASLVEAVAELRDVAGRWEAQAQLGLAQAERLKDLLEESATWDAAGVAEEAASGQGGTERTAHPTDSELAAEVAAAAAPGGGGSRQLEALCFRLHRELLLEKAQNAQLSLQVRALCMELTKASQRSGQMQHALVPLLSGVERRVAAVLGMRPKGHTATAGET